MSSNTKTTNGTQSNGHELTLLEQLENSGVNIDVDDADPEVAKSMPFTPHDMTSNQRVIHVQMTAPENKERVEETVKRMKGQKWEEVYCVLVAKIAKRVIPYISGRVLAQTSPSHTDDKEFIINHARMYARAYNAEGITNDRFCIKIPTTSAGVQAAAELNKEGIKTLGTALFSLPQAIAASQANMHAISMYLNAPRAHADKQFWPDVEDPATQHPMSNRHRQIRETYDRLKKETGKPQPQIKTASFISAREALAMKELGADHITISAQTIDDLQCTTKLPSSYSGFWKKSMRSRVDEPNLRWEGWYQPLPNEAAQRMEASAKSDPTSKVMEKDQKMADTNIDYLADGVLDRCNQEDEITRERLKDAMDNFSKVETQSKEFIEGLQKKLN